MTSSAKMAVEPCRSPPIPAVLERPPRLDPPVDDGFGGESKCVTSGACGTRISSSAMAPGPGPVCMATCSADVEVAGTPGVGPARSGVVVSGRDNDTVRPLLASATALARTSSLMRLSVPRSSSGLQRPQLVGGSA